ncbi:hypothetical protein ACX8Z9_04750 [Arthrobacter halodurans]|uniref:Uncharacterized protein n=1 Tax=Arthrobacter halodurans TaxID=516699 RepID=A0ABV4UTY3_9MICC
MTTNLMTLSDVARMAGVQRPVVTMWRSRSRGTLLPFPAASHREGAQELFEAASVVEWLRATGRGNNPDAAEDAAAHVVDGRNNFHAVSALLALRAEMGSPLVGLDAHGLLDAADAADPDDEYLYAELEAIGDELVPLAAYTDRLVDASYGVPAAFESLLADRFRSGLGNKAAATLSGTALDLVAAAALEVGAGSRLFTETTAGGTDLLLAVAKLLGEDADGTLQVLPSDSGAAPSGRPALRRLHAHAAGSDNLTVVRRDRAAAGTVHLAQFPGPGQPDPDTRAVLDGVDEIVLGLNRTERAVVIGPASVLVDRLDSTEMDNTRSSTLRAGRVRAVVRLPRGLLPAKPRQAMALWVLGPEPQGVPLGERRVMVADLLDTRLDRAAVQDLSTDLAASLRGLESVRRHAFRFSRLVRTASLLAARAGLVPDDGPSATAPTRSRAETVLRTEQAIAAVQATSGARPHTTFSVAARASNTAAGARSVPTVPATAARPLGALRDAGHVRDHPGTRIDTADLAHGNAGGVRVWGPGDLERGFGVPAPSAGIPALVLAARYPRARLTEPGDIVFRSGPQPAAVVDTEGSAVVRSPARTLRINAADPGGLLAAVVAADIGAAPPGNWRRWPVRTVPPDQAAALASALAELVEEQQAAAERLTRLAELAARLAGGVAAQDLEIIETDTQTEGRP